MVLEKSIKQLNRVSIWVSLGLVSLGGKVIAARWQVTLCDPIWHVISRSGVVILVTNCYIRVYFDFDFDHSSASHYGIYIDSSYAHQSTAGILKRNKYYKEQKYIHTYIHE